MSKSNMLLGLAKGKVGDLVFYRDGGEQRTRTRVVPKNPRSAAQMAQRVKIANVSGIYRAAAQILKDSFSNRPSNQSGYNAFASGAIINAPYLTSEMAKAGVYIPQPAMMSRGTLPTIPYEVVGAEGRFGVGIPVDLSQSGSVTIGAVSSQLINTYPFLQTDDEVHFVTLRFRPINGVDADVDIYSIEAMISSFSVDAENMTELSDLGLVASQTYVAGSDVTTNGEEGVFMSAIIVSRVDLDGRLQVSTQWAYMSDAAQSLYDDYRTDDALAAAIESYKATATPILR